MGGGGVGELVVGLGTQREFGAAVAGAQLVSHDGGHRVAVFRVAQTGEHAPVVVGGGGDLVTPTDGSGQPVRQVGDAVAVPAGVGKDVVALVQIALAVEFQRVVVGAGLVVAGVVERLGAQRHGVVAGLAGQVVVQVEAVDVAVARGERGASPQDLAPVAIGLGLDLRLGQARQKQQGREADGDGTGVHAHGKKDIPCWIRDHSVNGLLYRIADCYSSELSVPRPRKAAGRRGSVVPVLSLAPWHRPAPHPPEGVSFHEFCAVPAPAFAAASG